MEKASENRYELSEEDIEEIFDPKNLSFADLRLVEAWKADGLSRRRMAELLVYEM